ncbi:hypothetical protein [Clostridium botulinum]|uniref:hypothetical protein n=1 Tax=Clostridium botulinum TaxID=1491 RepID=UPI001E2EE00C|nr:hypothetical protein [Clostridium botulinum]MCD3276707.1 hypothetical protein [Clostridium botulinum C/D]MCD3288268.1 hypothetical protein [Clostridium botulinum C/D]MCD3290815.1 hypothetical protein [Clostridium botulinum C/D]MCD3303799.1 hypothetical protein [Clostridium botulinum C/D]
MTDCWYCGAKMIWNSDFTFEDYALEGEGVISILSCPNCQATAEFYHKIPENDMFKNNENN